MKPEGKPTMFYDDLYIGPPAPPLYEQTCNEYGYDPLMKEPYWQWISTTAIEQCGD